MLTVTPGSVIIDASVATAMAFGEPNSDVALELISGVELFAPTLLHYELCSVALKKVTQNPSSAIAITQGLADALSMEVELVSPDYSETLRLALQAGLSTYDASYLHVSLLLDAPLVTFDNRLQRAYEALT